MRRLLVSVAIGLALAACGSAEPGTTGGISGLREQEIELTDGRVITCVKFVGGYAGGLSCDWDS